MIGVTREDALATLGWLIDAGADEAILDTPVDRLKGPSPASAQRANDISREASPSVRPAAANIVQQAAEVSLSTAPGAARALAGTCRTLAELKSALESFDGGELKRGASKTVFGDGSPTAKIMLIGEAPGRDEDAQGIPFVGRAGKLLDQMIAAIGLDRTKVYITNVLPWRPPQNRDPSPEEAASCLPFLQRHIELINPEILILLGAVSARYVLGTSEGILRLRGKWDVYQSASGDGLRSVPTMPTLHPAYLLRQPAAKRLAWRDLCSVAEKMEHLGLA